MIDNGLKQLLILFKHKKSIERLCNCITYFPQFEKLSAESLDEFINEYINDEENRWIIKKERDY